MDPSREEVEVPMPLNSAYPGSHVHGHGHIMPTMFHQHHNHDHHQHQHQHHHHDEPSHTNLQVTSSNGQVQLMLSKTLNQEVRYKECLKNHAASMGGRVTDGCGEFMPSGEEASIEALICSVCNCHRNFHRKEVEGEANKGRKVINLGHHKNMLVPPPAGVVNGAGFGGYPTATTTARAVPIMPYNMESLMVCSDQSDGQEEGDGGGGGACGGVAYMGFPPQPTTTTAQPSSHHHNQMLKKRFRTKFSQEQKEKLFSFAEKAGWTIQKQEESVVQQFCQEIGIKRKVLKVWMHNNKHNLNKKTSPITNPMVDI